MSTPNNSKNKGFTIVEAIIAIFVLSAVMLSGYAILHHINYTMGEQLKEADNRKIVRSVVEQITKDIQEAESVVSSNEINQSNGTTISYTQSNKKLIREIDGRISRVYEGIIAPFSIVETQENLYTITLNYQSNKKVLETNTFKVARGYSLTLEPGDDEDEGGCNGGRGPFKSELALVTPSNITMSESAIITGDIGSQFGNINITSSTLNGNIFTEGDNYISIKYSTFTGQHIIDPDLWYDYPDAQIPLTTDINNYISGTTEYGWSPIKPALTEDTYFDRLNITNYMRVDVSNGDRVVRVNDLVLSGGSGIDGNKIQLIGNGKLFIFIENSFSMEGIDSINKTGNSNQLHIIVNSNGFELNGNCKLNGNLYIRHGELEITGGATINGNVVSNGNSVLISGGATAINGGVYAPNAAVNMSGSMKINGWVIAGGDVSISGGGTGITYNDVEFAFPTIQN